MNKITYVALYAMAMGLANMAQATTLFITNSTGAPNSVMTNGDHEACVQIGSTTIPISGWIYGAIGLPLLAEKEQNRWAPFPIEANKTIDICTVGKLIATAQPGFCFMGKLGEFYKRLVIPVGAIWQVEYVPQSAAGNKQLIEMPM